MYCIYRIPFYAYIILCVCTYSVHPWDVQFPSLFIYLPNNLSTELATMINHYHHLTFFSFLTNLFPVEYILPPENRNQNGILIIKHDEWLGINTSFCFIPQQHNLLLFTCYGEKICCCTTKISNIIGWWIRESRGRKLTYTNAPTNQDL